MTCINTCQTLCDTYISPFHMTYLQVSFRSYIFYAASSAGNALPFPLWQNLPAFKSPLKFFLFRKPLAPDSQWLFLSIQNPRSNKSSQQHTPRNSLCMMWPLSNCLLPPNSWKAGASVSYFSWTSLTLSTHIALRTLGEMKGRWKEEN